MTPRAPAVLAADFIDLLRLDLGGPAKSLQVSIAEFLHEPVMAGARRET